MVLMPRKLVEEMNEYFKPLITEPYKMDNYNTAIFAVYTKKSNI